MITITDPMSASDMMLLKTSAGTLSAAADAWRNITSFVIPHLYYEDRVLLVIEALKSDPLDLSFINANTSETSADTNTASPGYMKIAQYYAWCRSDVNRSFDASKINYHNVASAGAQVVASNNATWGNIETAKTIYVNMKSAPGYDIYWKFSAWLLKKNIK